MVLTPVRRSKRLSVGQSAGPSAGPSAAAAATPGRAAARASVGDLLEGCEWRFAPNAALQSTSAAASPAESWAERVAQAELPLAAPEVAAAAAAPVGGGASSHELAEEISLSGVGGVHPISALLSPPVRCRSDGAAGAGTEVEAEVEAGDASTHTPTPIPTPTPAAAAADADADATADGGAGAQQQRAARSAPRSAPGGRSGSAQLPVWVREATHDTDTPAGLFLLIILVSALFVCIGSRAPACLFPLGSAHCLPNDRSMYRISLCVRFVPPTSLDRSRHGAASGPSLSRAGQRTVRPPPPKWAGEDRRRSPLQRTRERPSATATTPTPPPLTPPPLPRLRGSCTLGRAMQARGKLSRAPSGRTPPLPPLQQQQRRRRRHLAAPAPVPLPLPAL